MKPSSFIFFFCVLFGFSLSFAQDEKLEDSIHILIQRAQKFQEEYNYEQSLTTAKEALRMARMRNDSKSQAYIYMLIAKHYHINTENTIALHNYKKALILSRTAKDEALQADIYNKTGVIYNNKKASEKALQAFETSYAIAKKRKDAPRMLRPLLHLASFYIDDKKFSVGHSYLSAARKHVNSKSEPLQRSIFNTLIATYFIHLKDYDKAKRKLDQAISIAQKEIQKKDNKVDVVALLYDQLATTYKSKSILYQQKKWYKTALQNRIAYQEYLSKSQELKKLVALQKANIKFDVDLKDEQIKQAEVAKAKMESEEIIWHISIFLGAILILISFAFLLSAYRNNRQKKKLNEVLLQKNKELVSAKETAEQVATLKSKFISTVSHELRTPLYGVIGLTALLMEDPDNQKRKEYLDSLKFSGDYLLALINDVLQLSKIETNKVSLEKVFFDLRALIEGIVNSLRTKQHKNQNQVHIDIDDTIQTNLAGDSVRLSQILMNLVGNALKFTKNGNIWIRVSCLKEEALRYTLRFSIKDDGIGIPMSKQKTIFENFAQVKNETSEYEGTGLGLAIVKKLIQLHGSEIHIQSEEGKGAEFYFDLKYDKAQESIQEGEKARNLDIGTTNFNILIVDDNKINQVVTANILKKKGYTCQVASDGVMAIDMISKGIYDLVLMDVNMPKMNGLDATKAIRKFNAYLPIIALTAVEEGEIRAQALAVGMNDVIVKPYDTQLFFQAIIRNISEVVPK